MFIARAMCRLTHVTVAALCCSCSLLCISNSGWATDKEAGRWRELSLIQFSCDCNYSLVKHNKTPVYSMWGLLRVCVRPARLPVLTWVPSSVPPGTISKIPSWPGLQRIKKKKKKKTRFWQQTPIQTHRTGRRFCGITEFVRRKLIGTRCGRGRNGACQWHCRVLLWRT